MLYLRTIITKLLDHQKRKFLKIIPSSAKLRLAIRSKNKFVYPENLFQKFNKYLEIEATNV